MSGLNSTFLSKTFAAKVVGEAHKRRIELESKTWWQHELNKYPSGSKITVILTNQKPKRTENQNRYYWMYLGMIADETGEDIDDLHTLFKGMFLTKEVVEIMGHKIRRARSTTELSTIQFSGYIERIEELTGILAPPAKNFDLKSSKNVQYPDSSGSPKF